MNRALRFITALVYYRDVHYARRLMSKAGSNLRRVCGALGADYIRVVPYRDFGGAPGSDCERFTSAEQPAGFVRMNLAPYHLVLPEVQDRKVIEAGTNEGAGAALFASRAREVLAFDRSPEAIAAARARYVLPNLRFEVHDATREFPVEAGWADVVFASETIEHLPQGRTFFAAAARALAPGGRIIVKTPNDDFNRLENRLNPHHTNPYDTRRLRAELAEHFQDVELSGFDQDIALETSPEERPDSMPPEAMPYRFGDPIVIDRVLVTRMRVTPRVSPLRTGHVPEFLLARARKAS